MGLSITKSRFKDLKQDYNLRFDSKFYIYINRSRFKIINKSKYDFVKLKNLISPDYEEVEYENDKMYKGIETAEAYFDKEGYIKDYMEVSKENHPERLKYLAKKDRIVISSLKGAKSVPFIVNPEIENYILSSGFYIFDSIENFDLPENKEISRKFWCYVLRSKIFRKILDNHLSRGIGISAYKEIDLLRLKVPSVPIQKRKDSLEKIEKLECEIKSLNKKIPNMQDVINSTFNKELGFVKFEEYAKKKNQFFQIKFKDIGKRKHLRFGARYNYFWKYYEGILFKKNGDYVSLRNLMWRHDSLIFKKGYLDKKYILIDKEDVEPKTGIIKEEVYVDKIESDKILFEDCELLISKIDPFLGQVIINDKNKGYIGTTEFIPFTLDNTQLDVKFAQYLFLSKNYLYFSKKLMAGKRQPRINVYEILSLKIPEVSILKQREIVNKLDTEWGDVKQTKQQVEFLRNKIEELISSALCG